MLKNFYGQIACLLALFVASKQVVPSSFGSADTTKPLITVITIFGRRLLDDSKGQLILPTSGVFFLTALALKYRINKTRPMH